MAAKSTSRLVQQKGRDVPAAYLPLRPNQRAFLSVYETTGNIRRSCEAAKISRWLHWYWCHNDEQFLAAFDLAKELARTYLVDKLEAEAERRAVDGWDEPVFHEGEIVGHKRRYSDNLLMFRLKGEMPAKYVLPEAQAAQDRRIQILIVSADEAQKRISNGSKNGSASTSLVEVVDGSEA